LPLYMIYAPVATLVHSAPMIRPDSPSVYTRNVFSATINIMNITAIHTRPLSAPRDDLYELLRSQHLPLEEYSVLCVTSKVLAIHQGRTIKINEQDPLQKDALIDKESDYALPRNLSPHGYVKHTITNGNLASSAGIDASNGNGYYILWPQHPSRAAKEIATMLKKKYQLNHLGVIITDSRSLPLRYGATGYALGAYGITPLYSYVGKPDVFDRPLKMEQANIVDSIATAGVLAMGEGDECTPLSVITGLSQKYFDDEALFDTCKVPLHDDIYYPFLKIFEDYQQ